MRSPKDGVSRTDLHQSASTVKGQSGEGGIRTHGPVSGTPVFKTGAIGHSATSPDLPVPRSACSALAGGSRRCALTGPQLPLQLEPVSSLIDALN